jgi:hypothetical protein
MYDIPAQYHKDELAKKQLLEEIISAVNISKASILPELQTIDSNILDIITKMTDGTQVTQIIPTSSPSTIAITESAISSGTSSSVSADALYVTFITSNDFTGTIGGISIPTLAVKEYPHVPGYVYPTISYTVTTGTLYIIEARA